ncbi:MAG: hypothetical protein WA830_00960 [Candidatus Sulfotelmatobacter sp.]
MRVVVQAECGFDLAAANPKPVLEPVVPVRPVQFGPPISDLPNVAVVELAPTRNLSLISADMFAPRSVKAALPWLVFMVSQLFWSV